MALMPRCWQPRRTGSPRGGCPNPNQVAQPSWTAMKAAFAGFGRTGNGAGWRRPWGPQLFRADDLVGAGALRAGRPWPVFGWLERAAVSDGGWRIGRQHDRQRHIPAPHLGRVNSANRHTGSGTQPLGALAGNALVALAALISAWALHRPFATAATGAPVMLIYATFRLRLDGKKGAGH